MAPQDSFIDEDDDCCPLCVEEFDLSDKNFRPCPCGYQICQFCFNNIKNNINGLCPACRRPYDEKTIEWKVVSQEEIAQFKANVQKNAKKKAEQRQKEAQKREYETLSRKHLSGLRVIQKNLVYVNGLSPGIREEEILQTLRGDKYFGQYGKIIKIVVSKAKQDSGQNGQSLGVYVTFERKEDAQKCITAVNGSQNGERVLRAQLGTTKYCSAYLRNETCNNKQCMFLHEPGDNDDSYSRQDLSSINSLNTQRPFPATASSSSSSRQTAQATRAQAPIQQAQPVAAAAQPMVRDPSKDDSESGDGSALPSSASWAKQRSRRGSIATSGAASSPAFSHSVPMAAEIPEEPAENVEIPIIETPEVTPAAVAQPERDPLIADLLKTLNSSASITVPSESTSTITFPPLFDDLGGEKRRAMREQDEQNRLHLEQESQADSRSATEPLEDEEPESGISGSLQLGGEPEEGVRESSQSQGFHNQRRPSTQLPIQRSSNGGPFGPSLSSGPLSGGSNTIAQNLSNLDTASRPFAGIEPQQHMHMRAARPGAEQYPPGMGNLQSNAFQQQGHNRQASRYNFGNENSAGSSVKPATNPKFLAQQSSMMPSGSHAQQANQFYASSMPGPPPGLKSSGTPPMAGMFGQSHSFGSMSNNTGFSGKDNGNDFLRDMARGRGNVGGSQAHDIGKREFFPSFLQSYPSASSTPAPSSGLASLYGSQPEAFHDFGQKQKKKGKKHRHANTSSSGGGGLVDLADPSILQARMHQQPTGVGQGLFGGQAQDDQDLPSLDEASSSVDALVADSTSDDIGLHGVDPFGFLSRSSTPSVPPGFAPPGLSFVPRPPIGLPHGHPEVAGPADQISKPVSRIVPTSAPFTPRNSSVPPTGPSLLANKGSSAQSTKAGALPTSSTVQAKKDLKILATNTGLSKTIAAQASEPQPNLQPEDFPALDSGKIKAATPSPAKPVVPVKAIPQPVAKKQQVTSSTAPPAAQSTPKSAERRNTPGVLNITVPPVSSAKTSAATPDATANSTTGSTSFPPLPPVTPGVATVPSPMARKVSKILPNVKTETPLGGSTPTSATSMFPANFQASRQPSLASTSRLDRAGTPVSEMFSDNASVTSASVSRANSPPPTKIGSAPVRTATKSMQKKQRQKEKEKMTTEVLAAKPEPEVEVAPIMGRKKKQKKERVVSSATAASTPAASRPASPGPPPEPVVEQIAPVQAVEEKSNTEKVTSNSVKKSLEPKSKSKAQRPETPEPPPAPAPLEVEDESERPSIPMKIFRDLLLSGTIGDVENLNFLKPPSLNHRHHEGQMDSQGAAPKLTISAEDRQELLAGHPVHKNVEGTNRIMLTPNGDCVRNLSPEEEKRYLALQASLAEETGLTTFNANKHQANNGFTLIGGRAVPNGPPSFFPQSKVNGTPMDPVSKIQRDEALIYINQYVLPSLSANLELENALTTNALDAEMLRSSGTSTWASWSNDTPRPEHGDNLFGGNTEGILATGLESMTQHFASDKNHQPGNVALLSLPDAEGALQSARKEAEALEKKLSVLLRRNRKVLMGSGH